MQEDSRPQRGGRGRPQSGGLDRRDSSSYQPRNGIAKRGNYPLDTFHVHQLVLARNVNRPQPFWPVRWDIEPYLLKVVNELESAIPCACLNA